MMRESTRSCESNTPITTQPPIPVVKPCGLLSVRLPPEWTPGLQSAYLFDVLVISIPLLLDVVFSSENYLIAAARVHILCFLYPRYVVKVCPTLFIIIEFLIALLKSEN